MILRPIVQFAVNSAGAGILSLIGMGGSGSAAAAGGDSGFGKLDEHGERRQSSEHEP